MSKLSPNIDRFSRYHNRLFRDPKEIIGQAHLALKINPRLLQFKTGGDWWDILDELRIQLLVSREYEHLLLSLGNDNHKPRMTFMPLPHPSGIAVDRKHKKIFIASTRNPNQVYTFAPMCGLMPCSGLSPAKWPQNLNALLPVKTQFFPGSLYVHDLAFIQNTLYINAVGHNCVAALSPDGHFRYAWWPKCVEKKGVPRTEKNFLQLNSIAAGATLTDSFFTASTDRISSRRPGSLHFPAQESGVVFSGKTREVICRGLTRPHSARLYQNSVWLHNSGFGEFGRVNGNEFENLITLPGWTRGLCFYKGIAFVGTSRVIPRFYKYAPGLNSRKNVCGIYAIDIKSSKILGHITWPYGNQIFAIEWLQESFTSGFMNTVKPEKEMSDPKHLFYAFKIKD